MDTADLSFALKLASPCIVVSNYLPSLSHYCFKDDLVFAHDDVSAIVVGLETGLKCGLRGDTLSRLVDLCGKKITLQPDGEGKVQLSSGRTKAELPSISVKDFRFVIPPTEYEFKFTLTDDVLAGLGVCVQSASADPLLQKNLTAVTLCTGPTPALYASDGISLVKFAVEDPESIGKKERQLLIPESICKQIAGIVSTLEPDKVTVGIASDHLRVDFKREDGPEVFLVGKLLPEDPPDFEKLIAAAAKLSGKPFTLPKGFYKAVAKVAVMVGGDTEPLCEIALADDVMTVRGSGNFGDAETRLEMDESRKAATATLHPVLLARYEGKLATIAVTADGIAMYGPGISYYLTTQQPTEE